MFKKFNVINIIIIVCGIFIIVLLGISIPILFNWIFTPESVTEVPSNISSTSTSLIVALLSIIALLITKKQTDETIKLTKKTIEENREHNKKTLNLTNESLNQNEEIMYIQLRFNDAKKSLYNFEFELSNAIGIYNELINIESEETCFNARGYIIAQYCVWIHDSKLFENIPLGLKNRFYSMPRKGMNEKHINFNKYYNSLRLFSRLTLKKYKNDLSYYHEFNQFIKKFNEYCISGRYITTFENLYKSNINERSIINFIIQTKLEINKRSVEDFILEERIFKQDIQTMKRKINEYKTLEKPN